MTSSNSPSAAPLQFASSARTAWLVICRDHGWLHGSRLEALAVASTIARGFGVTVEVQQ